MFSPIRSMKIKNGKIDTFFPNKIMEKYTSLSGDRNKSTDSYFITHSCTVSMRFFDNKKNNSMPFQWMGKIKIYNSRKLCRRY